MNGEETPDAPGNQPQDELGSPQDGISPEEEERLIELVGFLVTGIVEHADEVEVEEFFDDMGIVYGVRVHPDDLGRVIGRDGRVANALRSVVRASALKSGARVTVEIITDDSQLRLEDAA